MLARVLTLGLFLATFLARAEAQSPPPASAILPPMPPVVTLQPSSGPEHVPSPTTDVAVEVRFVSVPVSLCQKLDQEMRANKGETSSSPVGATNVVFLEDQQLRQLLELIQSDRRTNIMMAPKVTVSDGEKSSINISEQHYFVTGVDVVQTGGQSVMVPQNKEFTTGVSFTVEPTVSADRRFVQLGLEAKMTQLAPSPVPLFPVTSYISPIFEGGAIGQPIPFTQFIQQPCFNVQSITKKVSLRDGETLLFSGLHRIAPQEDGFGPPVLSKIPYVNRLFKRTAAEPEEVLVLVTPRILLAEEEESRVPPSPQPTRSVTSTPPADATAVANGAAAQAEVDQAQKLYHKAEHARHKGDIVEAGRIYQELHRTYPETRYGRLATRRLGELYAQEPPKVLLTGAEEQGALQRLAPPCPVQGDTTVLTRLLHQYQQACNEGRSGDARRLAEQALAVDPTCFRTNALNR